MEKFTRSEWERILNETVKQAEFTQRLGYKDLANAPERWLELVWLARKGLERLSDAELGQE